MYFKLTGILLRPTKQGFRNNWVILCVDKNQGDSYIVQVQGATTLIVEVVNRIISTYSSVEQMNKKEFLIRYISIQSTNCVPRISVIEFW